ncbi:MAG: hypothetical protein ACXVIJ_08575 [Thermoanaerobaculia bacterium]
MSDPVLTLVLLATFLATAAAVRFFETLDSRFSAVATTPFIAGFVAGATSRFFDESPLRVVVIGVMLTVATLYVRLTGIESEPVDGMVLGAVSGAAASLPLILGRTNGMLSLAECLMAGAVAGFGITYALSHVADKPRQLAFDTATAIAAVGAARLPGLLRSAGVSYRTIAISAASAIPLVVIITVFRQWADLRAELRHEASLGFIDDSDVRLSAHPFLRLGSGGWADPHAHREFVRLANRIALRKRQQRDRTEEVARLYQLEIIKLRMQIQEMSRIDHLARHAKTRTAEEVRSDTIAAGGMRNE